MGKSRIINLRDAVDKRALSNSATALHASPRVVQTPVAEALDFEDRFLRNFQVLREAVLQTDLPGLTVVAIDDEGVAGSLHLQAKSGDINTATVGRHSHVDLVLRGDPTLSLRHLSLLVCPLHAGGDFGFRVINLRSSVAFRDEHGHRMESVESRGPMMLACGRVALYFFPSTAVVSWECEPEEVWKSLPRRLYQDSSLPGALRDRHETVTRITVSPGPLPLHRRLAESDEEALGVITIISQLGHAALVVGPRNTGRGVIFGRYDRCDNHGLHVLTSRSVSRVHVLLLDVEGTLYLVDTGSKHGLYQNERRVRCVPLRLGDRAMIGRSLALLSFRSMY